MQLIDVCQSHPRGTAAILGNGPSLSDHSPKDVRHGCKVVLGVNRAWRWGPLDWWVTLDLPPWQEAQREQPAELSQANWAVLDTVLGTTDNPWVPRPDGLLPIRRDNTRPVRRLVPGMETRAYADTGILPGSGDSKDRVMTYSSSVVAAIHLALYMGCTRLVLYGVDLSFPKGRERFSDREPQTRDEFTETRPQLKANRRVLEEFAEAWGDRLTLICQSPVARLRGWVCPGA